MIVTIDDYRGVASTNARPSDDQPFEDDGSKFTVANAGALKLKLQALNNLLIRTPIDQHNALQFDDILRSASPRTYVNGSEEVYFRVKGLSWPSKIPEMFVKAYGEVVQKRPFTNKYTYKTIKALTPDSSYLLDSVSARSASPFSTIRPLLHELDTLCDTKLNDFFERADSQVEPFAFMSLPTELRLEVFDYLLPAQTLLRVFPKDQHSIDKRPPVRLDIMRVSKTLYKETSDHFFNKCTLYIEAYPDIRRGVWGHPYFTKNTAKDYAVRITGMGHGTRSKITRLEIRIIPEDAASPFNSFHPDHLDTSSLRQIYAALPNVTSIIISYERIPQRMFLVGGRARWPNESSYYNGQKLTLGWVHAQLPDKKLRVVWDLTHFRRSVGSAVLLREEILAQPMMRELIERDGALEMAQSVAATREDLRRWSEIRHVVLEAVTRL